MFVVLHVEIKLFKHYQLKTIFSPTGLVTLVKNQLSTWRVNSVVEGLPSLCEALGSISSITHKNQLAIWYSFSILFWLLLVPCNFILICGLAFQFLQKPCSNFHRGLHWIYRTPWLVLTSWLVLTLTMINLPIHRHGIFLLL